MRSLTWLCSLGLAASAWGQGLHYEQKLSESHGPAEVRVSQPVFKGGDPATAARLNEWVRKTVGDVQCSPFGQMPGSYSRDLTVDRLSAEYAVLSDSAEEFCGGEAHDYSWRGQFVIPLGTGEPLDVWNGLSDATQEHLRAVLIEHARKDFKNDECAHVYDAGWLDQLSLSFTDEGVVVRSDFPYVARACDSQLTIPLADFRAAAEASPEVRAFLDSW